MAKILGKTHKPKVLGADTHSLSFKKKKDIIENHLPGKALAARDASHGDGYGAACETGAGEGDTDRGGGDEVGLARLTYSPDKSSCGVNHVRRGATT